MVEYPERVHFGIRIMMQCLGVKRAVIGVERNKPDAIAALERTRPTDIDITVQPLVVKYPQGAEKMLIQVVTGREVPSGKLPMHVGTVVQNVGSIATIAEIFETGLPLIERVVTVTGPGLKRPSNLIVPVGTHARRRAGLLRRAHGRRRGDRLRRPDDGLLAAGHADAAHEGHHRHHRADRRAR